tara:strand:- start:1708 stop:2337 length:630 start_codon:yes stop_codon:yes gene_type:complete
MQDPRNEIQEMISDLRENLKEIEMKLWEIPHHDETEDYDDPYVPGAIVPDADYVEPAMIDEMDYEDFNDTETPITTAAIKDQLEAQGREIGIELDKRHNVDTLIAQLAEATPGAALPPADEVMDEFDMIEDDLMDEEDPLEHTHPDGVVHSHEGGDEPHHHHDDGMIHDHEGGDEPHTHDDTLPSDVEPPVPADELKEDPEIGEDSTQI